MPAVCARPPCLALAMSYPSRGITCHVGDMWRTRKSIGHYSWGCSLAGRVALLAWLARGRGKCSRWKVIGEGEQAYRYFTLIGFCLFLVFASWKLELAASSALFSFRCLLCCWSVAWSARARVDIVSEDGGGWNRGVNNSSQTRDWRD
jgi:hypothetical protein